MLQQNDGKADGGTDAESTDDDGEADEFVDSRSRANTADSEQHTPNGSPRMPIEMPKERHDTMVNGGESPTSNRATPSADTPGRNNGGKSGLRLGSPGPDNAPSGKKRHSRGHVRSISQQVELDALVLQQHSGGSDPSVSDSSEEDDDDQFVDFPFKEAMLYVPAFAPAPVPCAVCRVPPCAAVCRVPRAVCRVPSFRNASINCKAHHHVVDS